MSTRGAWPYTPSASRIELDNNGTEIDPTYTHVWDEDYSVPLTTLTEGKFPGWSDYLRIVRLDAPITDDEAARIGHIIGYAYRSVMRMAEGTDWHQDTPNSVLITCDITKTYSDDIGIAFEDLLDQLLDWLRDGTPIRKTDRAGEGTKGTRAAEGLGPNARFAVQFDNMD